MSAAAFGPSVFQSEGLRESAAFPQGGAGEATVAISSADTVPLLAVQLIQAPLVAAHEPHPVRRTLVGIARHVAARLDSRFEFLAM